jgi:hypothetical protein
MFERAVWKILKTCSDSFLSVAFVHLFNEMGVNTRAVQEATNFLDSLLILSWLLH